MDLNDFISNIAATGIANAARYEVIVNRPDNKFTGDLIYRTDSIDWPGRNIAMSESNYTGVPYKIANAVTYPDINMSVILSEDQGEKIFFEDWQDLIIGKHRINESSNMFNLSFYKDYIGTVEILQYNDVDDLTYTLKLIDAYPSSIGSITSSWNNGSEILRLPISFTYRYYKDKIER